MIDAVMRENVKTLWLSDMLGAPADPVMFRLAMIMKDGTEEDLQKDASAALLRRIALRISAERDIPFDDWTRPIPPGVPLSESFEGYLRVSLASDDEPKFARGSVADGCFLAGDDAETFRATLTGIVFVAVGAMVKEGYDLTEARECADFCAVNEHDRFRTLCDANGREKTAKL